MKESIIDNGDGYTFHTDVTCCGAMVSFTILKNTKLKDEYQEEDAKERLQLAIFHFQQMTTQYFVLRAADSIMNKDNQ